MPLMSPSSLPTPPLSSFPSSNALWAPFPLRHCPLSPFRHRPLPFCLLFLPQHPSSTPDIYSHDALGFSASALSQRSFGSSAPTFSSFQRSSPFLHRSVKQDRTEGLCSVLFGRTKGLRSIKQDQTETLRSILFGRMVHKGRETMGASAEKPGKGAEREHVPKSRDMILKKREETGGRRAAPRRRKGMV